jgi:hypothetical protein
VEFSKAQFDAVIREITTGMQDFGEKMDQVLPTATAAVDHWYVPDNVKATVMWLARETVEVGKDLLDLFVELLKGAIAPVYMFADAWDWMDVRGAATTVSSGLGEHKLTVDDSEWSGKAHSAYVKVAAAQSQAAGRVGSIASSTSTHLLACATAGAAFYVTLAAVLVKLIAASIAALAAFGSGVFSPAGAAIVLEEAGVNTAIIATAAGTLAAFLAAQATSMVNLHGEAVDSTSFPGGRWPTSNTSTYSDATVTDGDADWSLAK